MAMKMCEKLKLTLPPICLFGSPPSPSGPRAFLSNLSKKENHSRDEAMIVRAEAAQQNGFENIGLFGVSVLAANFAHIPAGTLNTLAAAYLATR